MGAAERAVKAAGKGKGYAAIMRAAEGLEGPNVMPPTKQKPKPKPKPPREPSDSWIEKLIIRVKKYLTKQKESKK
jgi:hypothetical protein